jgi:hypothetical protein
MRQFATPHVGCNISRDGKMRQLSPLLGLEAKARQYDTPLLGVSSQNGKASKPFTTKGFNKTQFVKTLHFFATNLQTLQPNTTKGLGQKMIHPKMDNKTNMACGVLATAVNTSCTKAHGLAHPRCILLGLCIKSLIYISQTTAIM